MQNDILYNRIMDDVKTLLDELFGSSENEEVDDDAE